MECDALPPDEGAMHAGDVDLDGFTKLGKSKFAGRRSGKANSANATFAASPWRELLAVSPEFDASFDLPLLTDAHNAWEQQPSLTDAD